MAILYVTEFQNMAGIGSRSVNIAPLPPVAEQTVAIGAASVQSAAFNVATQMIRVIADTVCSIEVGSAPVATATTMRLAANVPEYFAVSPGQKIAVITNT